MLSWCKSCHRAYYKAKPAGYFVKFTTKSIAKKQKYVEDYKVAIGCGMCGEKHPACLELHHIDASKKEFTVSEMVHRSKTKEAIDREIEKCVVLCSNCHRKEHFEAKRRKSMALTN